MNYFLNLGNSTYIPVKDVLYIMNDFQTSSVSKIKKTAKLHKTFYTLSRKKEALVVTIDGNVYVCGSNPETLAKRCSDLGYNMLNVDEGYYIASLHIKVLTNLSSLMVSSVKRNRQNKADDLQFVHQGDKRRSLVCLKTDQIVYLGKDSSDIINSIFGGNEKVSN